MKHLALLLSLTLPALSWAQGGEPPPVLVQVAPAVGDEVAATLWVPGSVVSLADAEIAAEVSGRVVWVAEVGAMVEAGDPIARVDDTELRLDLRQREAELASLDAQIKYERSQTSRLERLAQANNAAANQLDESRSRLTQLEQQRTQADVAAQRARWRLERAAVSAPFGGQVVRRDIDIGEYLTPGGVVSRVVDIKRREVRARAPLHAAGHIRSGDNVAVERSGRQHAESVRAVIPVGDERSRMFEVRVGAQAEDFVVGAPVRVALPVSGTRQLVAVPRDALVMRGDRIFVYRVNANGVAEKLDVATGVGVGDLVEVIGGVEAGDKLVVRGGERLRDGQKVTVSS